jgi:hypothetical protein
MKSLITITLIFGFKLLIAQNLNYAYHTGIETSYGISGFGNTIYYLDKSRVLNSPCNDQVRLVALQNGKEKFRVNVGSGAFFGDAQMCVLDDGAVITMCGTRRVGCDSGGDSYRLLRVDTFGQVDWNQSYSARLIDVLEWPGGKFCVATDGSVDMFDASGSQLLESTSIFFPLSGINSIARYDGTRLLVNVSDQGHKFIVVDSTFETAVDMVPSAKLISMQQINDGSILALDSIRLVKYSHSLTFQISSASTLPSCTITAFTHRNDSIFVVGVDNQNQAFFAILDQQFVVLYKSVTNIENSMGTGIHVKGGRVNVLTTAPLGKSKTHTFTGYFNTGLTGTLNGSRDIGVIDVTDLEAEYFTHYGYLGAGYFIYLMSANTTLRNHGTDTVKSFRLNHYSRGFYPYGYLNIGLNKEYSLVIPPGGTTTVHTGTFYTMFEIFGNAQTQFTANICFHTSVPDHSNDINIENDQACSDLAIVYTSLRDAPALETNVKVFPNPSSGSIAISSNQLIREVSVFDLSGKLIMTEKSDSYRISISTGALASGMYFLKIITDKRQIAKKIVVE